MEAFSLLKFWRINPGDDPSCGGIGGGSIADVTNDGHIPAAETDDETGDDEDSFFDLEFTVPGEDSNNDLSKKDCHTASDSVESHNDVFYKGRSSPSESNSKPQSPIAFLRSSTKFRVFMLFKKPKLDKTEAANASPSTPKQLAVKCDVEEFPIWSLLNRVNSTRSKFQKKSTEEDSTKRFTKDVVQKYLKLIRPLYVRVSKRYSDNVKFSDKASAVDPSSSPTTLRSPSNRAEEKQGSRAPPLRVVCKLGKSKSASSSAGNVSLPGSKRDDSLLLQHDGIQSAILHCKSSYNSSRDFSMLSRFARETSCDISDDAIKSSDDEKKRSSI